MYTHKSRFTFPCVSIEQAAAFEYDRPETWTRSQLVNAIADAMPFLRPINKKTLAAYLGMNPRDVSYGLHAVTGLELPEFLAEWRRARFLHLVKTQPQLSGKEMADRLGYSSQGALWSFLARHKIIVPMTRQSTWFNYSGQAQALLNKKKEEVKIEMNKRRWERLIKK